MQQERESSPSCTYTREQLLSKYRRFECPKGLDAHVLIRNPDPSAEPELYNPPPNLDTAVVLKKPPRTAVAAAVGAALGARNPVAAPVAGDLERTARRIVPPKPPNPAPLSVEDMKKSIVRWSDGRPLYMVAYKDLLPLADEFLLKRGIMRGRRYQEMYEASVADLYNQLVRQKRILLPAPLTQSFRLTKETSVALWPTFRELFLSSEDMLHLLSRWEASLDENAAALEPDAVMVLPPNVFWEYLDPKNTVQGPFTSTKMSEWFRGDFFPPNLPIRVCGTGQFTPLVELYPLAQRDVYVPFITTPPLEVAPPPLYPSPIAAVPAPIMPPREVVVDPCCNDLLQPMASQLPARVAAPLPTQPPEPQIFQQHFMPAPLSSVPLPEQHMHPQPLVTHEAPAEPEKHVVKAPVARAKESPALRQELRAQREDFLQREAMMKREAERIQHESDRVAAALLREKQENEELLAKRESLRREKEARDARALAEQLAIEMTIEQTLEQGVASQVPMLSGYGAPAKWKQPTVIDREDAGPSLEESRRIKESTSKSLSSSEWSKKLSGGKSSGSRTSGKGKKLSEVLPAPRSVWQVPRPAASSQDPMWKNDPVLDAATVAAVEAPPEPAAEVRAPPPRARAPVTRADSTPVTAAAPMTPLPRLVSDDARVNIQDLCKHYHITLDPDFVTILVGLPDLETVTSFLADNLPHLTDEQIAEFAEAFWDVVRNPFQPVVSKKGSSFNNQTHRRK